MGSSKILFFTMTIKNTFKQQQKILPIVKKQFFLEGKMYFKIY